MQVTQSCPTFCDAMGHRLLCPWNSPGKNTGVGSHSLLQEIFSTQGLNLGCLSWLVDFFTTEQTVIKFQSLPAPSFYLSLIRMLFGNFIPFWNTINPQGYTLAISQQKPHFTRFQELSKSMHPYFSLTFQETLS